MSSRQVDTLLYDCAEKATEKYYVEVGRWVHSLCLHWVLAAYSWSLDSSSRNKLFHSDAWMYFFIIQSIKYQLSQDHALMMLSLQSEVYIFSLYLTHFDIALTCLNGLLVFGVSAEGCTICGSTSRWLRRCSLRSSMHTGAQKEVVSTLSFG